MGFQTTIENIDLSTAYKGISISNVWFHVLNFA